MPNVFHQSISIFFLEVFVDTVITHCNALAFMAVLIFVHNNDNIAITNNLNKMDSFWKMEGFGREKEKWTTKFVFIVCMLKNMICQTQTMVVPFVFFLFCCSSLCVVACLKYVLILLKCKHIIERMPVPIVRACVCAQGNQHEYVYLLLLPSTYWFEYVQCIVIYLTLYVFFSRFQRCVQHFLFPLLLHRSAAIDEPLCLPSLLSLYSHSFSSNSCIYFLTVFISRRLLLLLIFEWYFTHLHWYVKVSW